MNKDNSAKTCSCGAQMQLVDTYYKGSVRFYECPACGHEDVSLLLQPGRQYQE